MSPKKVQKRPKMGLISSLDFYGLIKTFLEANEINPSLNHSTFYHHVLKECTNDLDCDWGLRCQKQKCEPYCSNDRGCASGFCCKEHKCEPCSKLIIHKIMNYFLYYHHSNMYILCGMSSLSPMQSSK